MQTTMKGFEPTEKDLVDQALALPLDVKIKKAIALLQAYEDEALKHADYGYYLANSYGKDSITQKQLCILAGVKFQDFHNITTIDPPELIRFGRKHHKDCIELRRTDENGKNLHLILDRMVDKANPPTRLGRWCCDEYKGCCSGDKCDTSVKLIGVRIAESARRAALWKQVNYHNKTNSLIIAPIAYWTDKDVWDFIKQQNMPYCELYDEGFSRLGCVGCPLAGSKGQDKEFKRWPGYEKLWMKGFQNLWDKWHGVPTIRTRVVEFMFIEGKMYAGNMIRRKNLPDGEVYDDFWDRVTETELDTPIEFEDKLYGNSRQRFFEKYRSPEGFYQWWRSGGKFTGDQEVCSFEEMMMNK